MDPKHYQTFLNSLPTHPDIFGRENYFNSAVFVPFILIENQYHLLFQKRSENIRQGGDVCFPGGGFDKMHDKTHEDTAIRETCEELGITSNLIKVDGKMDKLIAGFGAIVEIFVGKIDIKHLDELKINHEEVKEVFTLPLSYFMNHTPTQYHLKIEVKPHDIDDNGEKQVYLPAKKLGLPKQYWQPWSGRLHPIYAYETPHGLIWGLTATITRKITEFYQKILSGN